MRKVGSTTDTADANGEYTNGNVANGVSPTIINVEMLNTFQRELVNVVEGAGIALDPNDDGQVLKALDKIIDDKFDCSISFNGYQKFASGLVKQWGLASITTDSYGNFLITPDAELFKQGVFLGRLDFGESNFNGVSRVIAINTYPNTNLKKNINGCARCTDNGAVVANSKILVTFDVTGK